MVEKFMEHWPGLLVSAALAALLIYSAAVTMNKINNHLDFLSEAERKRHARNRRNRRDDS